MIRNPPFLVLGTAQLGAPYGAANRTGMPSEEESLEIVRSALAAGIRHVDTARAYGDAERRLGLALDGGSDIEVVTKLDPLRGIPASAPPEVAVEAAAASLATSRHALRRERLDVVLLHRAEHRTAWDGAVWTLLRREHAAGGIGRLGISVQSPAEALAALEDQTVGHLQIPYNLLDRRWDAAGVAHLLRHRSNVAVHVRSVLLQGLLAGTPNVPWPEILEVSPSNLIAGLHRITERLDRLNPVDLCYAFVRAQTWVDGIVIGMETSTQLTENLSLFSQPPLQPEEAAMVRAALPAVPETLLDPSAWPAIRAAAGAER